MQRHRRRLLLLPAFALSLVACAAGSPNKPTTGTHRPADPAVQGDAGPAQSKTPAAKVQAALTPRDRREATAGFDCAAAKSKKAPTTCSLAIPESVLNSRARREEGGSSGDENFGDYSPDTLDDLMANIACAPEPTVTAANTKAAPRWDHKTTPERLDLIEKRFGVTRDERDHLMRDGMVVSSRLEYTDYGSAMQDVHRSQLPFYFSVDALFHAIYIGNDRFLAELEANDISPVLQEMLEKMHERLGLNKARYRVETLKDLDIYLTVARRLIAPPNVDGVEPTKVAPISAANEADVARLVATVKRAGGFESVSMFGRTRLLDMGQFRPRGHYASAAKQKNPLGADLSSYFRAAMWLSRIEFNLVSRSSQSSSPITNPGETPREATMAMALAELVRDTGELDHLNGIDKAWEVLAGNREDVSQSAILDLMKKAKITDSLLTDAPEKLRTAIGTGFVRTARTHYAPPNSPDLPVIATFLGPRITSDTQATRPVVHPNVNERREVPAVEMTYLLGHDRALNHLGASLTAFPSLKNQMDLAREVTFGTKTFDAKPASPAPTRDLYSGWFAAIRGLSEHPSGTRPSFMESDAFKDMRINSAVAAYGQIRHNYVLIVPTSYDEGGCEIPDSYVEPAPAVYSALIDYAKRGQNAAKELGRESGGYFARLENTLRVLKRIGDRELVGEPLREEEKRFLAMVAEDTQYLRNGYGPSTPLFNGWYYDLFREAHEAHDSAAMVADYFASNDRGTVDYAGVSAVRMGFFVIDTNGGKPRIAVGPVARSFQSQGPIAPRFSDDEVNRMNIQEPWAKSYTAKSPTTAPFTIKVVTDDDSAHSDDVVLDVTSSGNVGNVTISVLDHHKQPLASVAHEVKGSPGRPAKVRYVIRAPKLTAAQSKFGMEALHVTAGSDFHWVSDESIYGDFLHDETYKFQVGPTSGKLVSGGYEHHQHTEGKRARY